MNLLSAAFLQELSIISYDINSSSLLEHISFGNISKQIILDAVTKKGRVLNPAQLINYIDLASSL